MNTTKDVLDHHPQCYAERDLDGILSDSRGGGRDMHQASITQPASPGAQRPKPIDADEYKSLMRCWATGVTIITTVGPDGPHGMTASSFTGVSLDPPLILVCISRHTHTHEHLKENDAFGVHLLHAGQEEFANRCAGMKGDDGHRLLDLPHAIGPFGVPLLTDCLMALVCRVRCTYDGGDHTIFLAEVHRARMGTGAPLLYFNRAYHRLGQ